MKKFLIMSAIAALTTATPAMAGSGSAAALPQYFNSENGPVATFPRGSIKGPSGPAGAVSGHFHSENGPAIRH